MQWWESFHSHAMTDMDDAADVTWYVWKNDSDGRLSKVVAEGTTHDFCTSRFWHRKSNESRFSNWHWCLDLNVRPRFWQQTTSFAFRGRRLLRWRCLRRCSTWTTRRTSTMLSITSSRRDRGTNATKFLWLQGNLKWLCHNSFHRPQTTSFAIRRRRLLRWRCFEKVFNMNYAKNYAKSITSNREAGITGSLTNEDDLGKTGASWQAAGHSASQALRWVMH